MTASDTLQKKMVMAHRHFSRPLVCKSAFLFLLVLALGCSKEKQADKQAIAKAEILISSAASTKDVVQLLADDWKDANNVEVKINAGPSSGLATQILAGAPADLFLSANQQWADKLAEAKQVQKSARLLTNKLVLVVPRGNPADVREPTDLLNAKVKKIALAGEKVPAGMYADQALTKLDLLPKLLNEKKIARGQDVRSALSYVERKEAEAGIVYSTDVTIAAGVESVYEFDPALHDEIIYVLVLLKKGASNPAAEKFFDYLKSPAAEPAYKKFGFIRL